MENRQKHETLRGRAKTLHRAGIRWLSVRDVVMRRGKVPLRAAEKPERYRTQSSVAPLQFSTC